jgi:raffinose synthase
MRSFLIFYLYLFTIGIGLLSCSKKKEKMFDIDLQDNSISISWNGQLRLSGLIPVFENAPYDQKEIRMSVEDSVSIFSIQLEKTENPIKFTIQKTNKDILIFSLFPNGHQSLKGEDFIGLFFSSIPGYNVGLASYKYGSVKAWTMPKQITTLDSLNEKDNQFFIWQYSDSTYAAVMPLAGRGYVSNIGKSKGKFGARSRCLIDNYNVKNVPVMAISFGKDPYKAIQDLYEAGMTYMNKKEGLRKNKQYPEMLDQLMWCTWNSFGHGLDEKKVLEGMDAFKKQGFKLPLLLLDDGWSVVSSYGTGMLKSFEPEKTKFPNGFKSLIEKLKKEYGVKEVGVWHAFNGYWAGIDPKSELGEKYKADLVPYLDKVAWTDNPIDTFYFMNPKGDIGFKFYDDWYTYLKSQGISFLKVDNQLIMDRIARNNNAFSETAQNMQNNLQLAVKKHFNGNVINCMDMTTDAVYNYGSSAIARSSEDYFPENFTYKMDAGNAAVHVIENAYNSLWWSQMVYPDFDMFQSHHPNAEYHAIARAISGGPIYITDSPAKNNFDIINKLIYSDGKIIRSDRPAMPTQDCLFLVQDPKIFKLQSMSRKAGMLAVFNAADSDSVSGSFSASDVYQLTGKEFAIYDYFRGTIRLATFNESINVDLPRMGYKLYYVVPLQNKYGSLGLINKYNGPKTIKKETIDDKSVKIELYEGGTYAAYSERKPSSVATEEGKLLNFTFKNGLLKVEVPLEVTKLKINF